MHTDRPGRRASGAVVMAQQRYACGPLQLLLSRDNISRPVNWSIRGDRHAFVVHLGGRMDHLETELEGHAGSRGPALPGEVWSIPAERAYASRTRGGSIQYGVIYLDPQAMDGLTGGNVGWREMRPVAGVRDDYLHQSVRRFAQLGGADDDLGRMEREALGRAVCCYLFQVYQPGTGRAPGALTPAVRPLNAGTVRALRDYIQDNLGNAIGLDDLAALAGLRVNALLIAFRQAFGRTPAQYIIAQRLRQAQHLLASTRRDITRIALDTGFSSHSHLSNAFVRHVGRTPSRFRREAAPAQAQAARWL